MLSAFWVKPPSHVITISFFLFSAIALNLSHPLSSDEGYILNGAWNLYNGKILYKDFFSFVAPGSYYLTKFSFDILGPNYYSAKLFSLLLLLFSVYAVYQITKIISGNYLASLVAAWLWLFVASNGYQIINYNPHSSYLSAIAIWLFIRARIFKKLNGYFLCGLVLGLTLIFLQHKGAIIILTLLVISSILLIKKKLSFKEMLTIISGIFVFPTFVILSWGPRVIIDNLMTWVLKNDLQENPISPWQMFLFALSYFILVFALIKTKKLKSDLLLILSSFQVALLLSMVTRRDIYHLSINIYPYIIIFTLWLFLKFPQLFEKNKLVLLIWASALALLIFFHHNLPYLIFYNEFKNRMNEYGIKKFYSHPYFPGLYFEMGIENKYPYDFLLAGMHPPEAFSQNLKALEKEKPEFVILSYSLAYHITGDDYQTQLDKYIQDNYSEFTKLSILSIVKRKN